MGRLREKPSRTRSCPPAVQRPGGQCSRKAGRAPAPEEKAFRRRAANGPEAPGSQRGGVCQDTAQPGPIAGPRHWLLLGYVVRD